MAICFAPEQAAAFRAAGLRRPSPIRGISCTLAQPLPLSCEGLGGQLGVEPRLAVEGDALGGEFNMTGSGSVTPQLCGLPKASIGASTVISAQGIAICGELLGKRVGIGATRPSSFRTLNDIAQTRRSLHPSRPDVILARCAPKYRGPSWRSQPPAQPAEPL